MSVPLRRRNPDGRRRFGAGRPFLCGLGQYPNGRLLFRWPGQAADVAQDLHERVDAAMLEMTRHIRKLPDAPRRRGDGLGFRQCGRRPDRQGFPAGVGLRLEHLRGLQP